MDKRPAGRDHASMSLTSPLAQAATSPAAPHKRRGPFGIALRQARAARRMSQLDLSLACEISSRHISFLESGRAQPSREMVLRLTSALLLPLAARNSLLQAAGFAPLFPASQLNSAALAPLRAVISEMIARHAPYPAMLIDRHWNVLQANPTAQTLLDALGAGQAPAPNLVRMMTESQGAVELIANLGEMISEMLARLELELLHASDDQELAGLLALLHAARIRHPHVAQVPRRPLVPLEINLGGQKLAFLSSIVQFATSEDVTVRDLRLELLFAADEQTRAALNALGQTNDGA